jgi:hypothetical protein
MYQRPFQPAYIIKIGMYKRAVPPTRRRNAYNSQRSEIAQAKYTCKFQKVDEKRSLLKRKWFDWRLF